MPNACFTQEIDVFLDGYPVAIPPPRRSVAAIGSYLDMLALQQGRILCGLNVDGQPVCPIKDNQGSNSFREIRGETFQLDHLPLKLIQTAIGQASRAQEQVLWALVRAKTDYDHAARELWWSVARELKNPLLTLSLAPDKVWGPATGHASYNKTQEWQLEQLAAILEEVEANYWSQDSQRWVRVLENRVMPWIDGLLRSLQLMRYHFKEPCQGSKKPGFCGTASCAMEDIE